MRGKSFQVDAVIFDDICSVFLKASLMTLGDHRFSDFPISKYPFTPQSSFATCHFRQATTWRNYFNFSTISKFVPFHILGPFLSKITEQQCHFPVNQQALKLKKVEKKHNRDESWARKLQQLITKNPNCGGPFSFENLFLGLYWEVFYPVAFAKGINELQWQFIECQVVHTYEGQGDWKIRLLQFQLRVLFAVWFRHTEVI